MIGKILDAILAIAFVAAIIAVWIIVPVIIAAVVTGICLIFFFLILTDIRKDKIKKEEANQPNLTDQ